MLEKMTKLGDFAAIKFMKAAYTRRKANQSLSFFDAVELFNGMVQTRPLPHISQFNKALGTITRMGHYATALFLIHNLQFLQGIQVDLHTFSIAINCYCHLNRVHFGFSILGTLFKCGYTPNVYILSTLINGLILEDKTPEAVELFKKLMRNRCMEPLLMGFAERGTLSGLMIIDGLCKDRMADDALKLFFKMKEEGIRPDVAFGMLREMLDSDISPNICTFSVLVDAHTKEGMAKEAEEVLEVMIQRAWSVDPDVVTYNTLMDGYCLQGRMDEAIRVFNTMVDRGLQPNVHSYNILINGYCKKMKMDEAMDLFREMPQRGLKPNNGTFNTILQGFFRSSRCSAAQELFNEMQAVGKIPDSQTYAILLDGLCKNGRVVEAYSLFQLMERSNLHLDIVMYSILINGFCKVKKLDTAKALFNNLSSKGLHPNVKTYTMMIQGLCEEGLLDEAKELFVKMEENGCLPNDATYNIVIQGFLGQQKCHEALVLLEEMIGRGFSPDASTSVLIVDLIALATKGQDHPLQVVIKKFLRNDRRGIQKIQ
ncbi:unnamed protein product [Camellia sinensis]